VSATATLTLGRAIALAARAHRDQKDRDGQTPYILHPLAVMQAVARHGTDAQIVAVLHDTLEDTEVTVMHLKTAGASRAQIDALIALTRGKHETYASYIDRCLRDPLAAVVKIADHDHNNNEERLARLKPEVAARLRAKYAAVADKIESARKRGAP
jgi:(p)ppGpp synthase/HD superfamily hydrolase